MTPPLGTYWIDRVWRRIAGRSDPRPTRTDDDRMTDNQEDVTWQH